MAKDYSKAKIYKLVDDDEYYYYGSTCQTLEDRFSKHQNQSEKSPNAKVYQHFLNIGWNNVKIQLVTNEFSIENKDQLRQFEDTFIEPVLNDPKCLNERRAYVSIEEKKKRSHEYNIEYFQQHKDQVYLTHKKYIEQHQEEMSNYMKQYREDHKEELQKNGNQYWDKNKEKLNKKRSEKIDCTVCNTKIARSHKAQHSRTKTHLANMQK